MQQTHCSVVVLGVPSAARGEAREDPVGFRFDAGMDKEEEQPFIAVSHSYLVSGNGSHNVTQNGKWPLDDQQVKGRYATAG